MLAFPAVSNRNPGGTLIYPIYGRIEGYQTVIPDQWIGATLNRLQYEVHVCRWPALRFLAADERPRFAGGARHRARNLRLTDNPPATQAEKRRPCG